MKRKILILATILVLSIAIVLAGVNAWFYDTDDVPNEFVLPNLEAKITERYDPRVVVPGASIEKNVTINSESNIPILIRVRFSEALQMLLAGDANYWDDDYYSPYPIEPQDNGAPGISWRAAVGGAPPAPRSYNYPAGVAKVEVPLEPSADLIATLKADEWTLSNPSGTWQKVTVPGYPNLVVWRKIATGSASTKYTYFAYYESGTTRQLAEIVPDHSKLITQADLASATVRYAYNVIGPAQGGPTNYIVFSKDTVPATTTTWRWNLTTSSSTPTDISQYIEFIFGPDVVSGIPALSDTNPKWFYYDGYFYYNTLLWPEDAESLLLLDRVVFAESVGNVSMGNAFQGAKYTLTPQLEALQPTALAVTGQWLIPVNSNPYSLYSKLAAICATYNP